VHRPPVLILAWGNPSRGDDALGPRLIERLQDVITAPVFELLTDFQLQIEHALGLVDRRLVVFADAAATGLEPFRFGPVLPDPLAPVTTHALSPGALLEVYRRVVADPGPACHLLGIRGYRFDLGGDLSGAASVNLDAAATFLQRWLLKR
jgi:hydrogenase maturation protease